MQTALNTLKANGLSTETYKSLLAELLENDALEDCDDARGLVVHAWQAKGEDNPADADWELEGDHEVNFGGFTYAVMSDDDADAACTERIEDSVWAFRSGFLSGATGLDERVFEALQDRCESANEAITALINGSCGMKHFVEQAMAADGRGHFLSPYDGEEYEYEDWYIYRIGRG
jgi:hypothetical protein